MGNNQDFFNLYVVMFRGELMILKRAMSSQVYREDGSTWLACELGPISEFEIIGEF